MRPQSYHAVTLSYTHTFYLGFLAVFFLVLECLTGTVLMVYYTPTVEAAHGSIIRLMSEVPFGWLMRDLHRLGGECLIAVAFLHMIRVFVTGTYRDEYRFTWVVGIGLFLCILLLAFTGYLLPWDQLAFWAVTIGTGLVETIPLIGKNLTLLLRGGASFGQDGLLRFYLLHIIVLPLSLFLFFGIHYYRISRLHANAPPPAQSGAGTGHQVKTAGKKRVQLFPNVFIQELTLSLFALAALIITSAFFYDAPLEHHADPSHTPVDTRAPWFFLWLQGALKLGDTFLTGICLPAGLIALLCTLPYLDHTLPKPVQSRPVALGLVILSAVGLVLLSLLGNPKFGVHLNPVIQLTRQFAPDEGPSKFHGVGFANLIPGIYATAPPQPAAVHGPFRTIFQDFKTKVEDLTHNRNFHQPVGVILVEDWQADLKRITIRVSWTATPQGNQRLSSETRFFVHRSAGFPGLTAGGRQ